MKRITTFVTAAVLAATPGLAQVSITAETAAPVGAPYLSTTTLGEVASAAGVADFQALDSLTLTNSLQNVAEGKSDMTAVPFILPFLLSKGAGPYGKLGPEKGAELIANVQVLYTYNFGGMSLYHYNSSAVKGWGDLEGKNVVNGPPRGGALSNARALIKIATGLDDGSGYTGVQANWGQIVKTITDGSGDAVVLPIYFPDSRMIQASASGEMPLHSVPRDIFEGEAMQKYLKRPGTVPFVFDLAGFTPPDGITVVSEDSTFRSPATAGGEVVQASMDFDLAKSLTAAYLANLDTLMAKAPFAKYVSFGGIDAAVTGMCGPNPLKYHLGAVAAWEEAGYTVPDCAKP